MRKATASERYLYENFYWLAVFVFVFIPFISNFAIALAKLVVSGDLAYGNLAENLQILMDILSLFSSYVGIGIICAVTIRFGRHAKPILILSLFSHFIIFVSAIIALALYDPYFNILETLFVLGIDMFASLLIYCIIIFIVFRISKTVSDTQKIPKIRSFIGIKHPVLRALLASCITYNAVQILLEIKYMIECFLDPAIGLPMNANDVLYWVVAYLSIILYAAIGYMLTLATCHLAEHFIRRKSHSKYQIS